MKKELKDYLHLYIGCMVDHLGDITTLKYCTSQGYCWLGEYKYKAANSDKEFTRPEMWGKIEHCKPILRPLSDMTEEEEEEYTSSIDAWNFGFRRNMRGAGESTRFLLSRHFDVFGLIESGLAISKPTLQKG